jgi:hypothetical protein
MSFFFHGSSVKLADAPGGATLLLKTRATKNSYKNQWLVFK